MKKKLKKIKKRISSEYSSTDCFKIAVPFLMLCEISTQKRTKVRHAKVKKIKRKQGSAKQQPTHNRILKK